MDPETISHADIPWTLASIDLIETVDVLAFDDDEIFEYTRSLQSEMRDVRALLHESLAVIQRLTAQLKQATTRLRDLRRRGRP